MSARIYGVVTDSDGEPVPDAGVVVEFQGGVARKFELTTNDEGEFIQMGLARGPYSVSAGKEGVGALTGTVTDPAASIRLTDATLGMRQDFLAPERS